jgi:hypothetical protein
MHFKITSVNLIRQDTRVAMDVFQNNFCKFDQTSCTELQWMQFKITSVNLIRQVAWVVMDAFQNNLCEFDELEQEWQHRKAVKRLKTLFYMHVSVTQEGESLSFTLSFLGGFNCSFLMYVVGMSTHDKNPEVFSSTQYFTKFWMVWQNLSLPNANSVS